jgi:flagellar basal-body rod protein FlgG
MGETSMVSLIFLALSSMAQAPVEDAAPRWNQQVSVKGRGYLGLKMTNSEIVYTRNLFATRNSDGVLTNEDGLIVMPGIQSIRENIWRGIHSDGLVSSVDPITRETEKEGQLKLYFFDNPPGLKPIGAGLYEQTEASGPADEASADQPMRSSWLDLK